MTISIFLAGDTILTEAWAYNAAEALADLDALPLVSLLKGGELTPIGTPKTAIRKSVGDYTCSLATPKDIGSRDYVVEYAGLSNGEAWVLRQEIQTVFALS
jgi:hypothetical protein